MRSQYKKDTQKWNNLMSSYLSILSFAAYTSGSRGKKSLPNPR